MSASLHDRIVALVAKQVGVRADRITAETTLVGDLNTAGDDGVDLLEAFGKEFSVDMSNCDPSHYFGTEVMYPWAPIYWLILAFREGSPEQRAKLTPITINDLVRSAELGRWDVQ